MKRCYTPLMFKMAICLLWAINSGACLVCPCGDNAFIFSGRGFVLPDQTVSHRFRLGLGNLYSSKSNSLAANEGIGTEHEREIRPSAKIGFNILDNFSLSIGAPFQYRRQITSTNDGTSREHSFGFGDAEISAVYMHNLWNNDGQFYTGGLSLASKSPTGNNNIHLAGERLDEHLQAGTGAFDWQLGGAVSRVTCASRYFASLYYRYNGTNCFAYHYGNAELFNIGGQWPVTDRLTGYVQANGRYARWDLDHSTRVENTGGWVTYLTPGIRMNLTEATSISSAVQLLVYQRLRGAQSEKAVISSGINIEF